MKIILLLVLLFTILNLVRLATTGSQSQENSMNQSAAKAATAQKWFFPMTNYAKRAALKKYGVLVDEKFYEGRENVFPNQYFGYHAGVDLETFPKETPDSVKVPVYAITDGEIIFVGEVTGYGGVVLEKLDGEKRVALYGHVRIVDLKIQEGGRVKAGQQLTVLGAAFSQETGGERKHLHFAIHKGTDQYFLGHEPSIEDLNLNWENPTKFLQAKGVVLP